MKKYSILILLFAYTVSAYAQNDKRKYIKIMTELDQKIMKYIELSPLSYDGNYSDSIATEFISLFVPDAVVANELSVVFAGLNPARPYEIKNTPIKEYIKEAKANNIAGINQKIYNYKIVYDDLDNDKIGVKISKQVISSRKAKYESEVNDTIKLNYKIDGNSKVLIESIEAVGYTIKVRNDGDNDGVTNDKDGCPTEKGSIAANGCPDYDQDGMNDKIDKCPYERGDISNLGCPVSKFPLAQQFAIGVGFSINNFKISESDVDIKKYSYAQNNLVTDGLYKSGIENVNMKSQMGICINVNYTHFFSRTYTEKNGLKKNGSRNFGLGIGGMLNRYSSTLKYNGKLNFIDKDETDDDPFLRLITLQVVEETINYTDKVIYITFNYRKKINQKAGFSFSAGPILAGKSGVGKVDYSSKFEAIYQTDENFINFITPTNLNSQSTHLWQITEAYQTKQNPSLSWDDYANGLYNSGYDVQPLKSKTGIDNKVSKANGLGGKFCFAFDYFLSAKSALQFSLNYHTLALKNSNNISDFFIVNSTKSSYNSLVSGVEKQNVSTISILVNYAFNF